MQILEKNIEQVARASGILADDLSVFFAEGNEIKYAPNDWLFHESTPRQWAGIILEGGVALVRGLHGSSRHIATMAEGSLISEGLFLDDDAHGNGAYTRNGASVWQISRDKLTEYRKRQSRDILSDRFKGGGEHQQEDAAVVGAALRE